jgi:hypothetical protein
MDLGGSVSWLVAGAKFKHCYWVDSRVFYGVIHYFRWITMQKTHLIHPASSFAPATS